MNPSKSVMLRFGLIASLVAGVFFAAYAVAQSSSVPSAGTRSPGASTSTQAGYSSPSTGADGSAAPACACCGTGVPTENGVSGDAVEGTAQLDGDVQRISVDVTTGIYQPNVIKLAAGVPAQIAFSAGSGCTAQVMSQDLGFFEDLSQGGATVTLPALEAGEYSFSCGMEMVFGKIVVQ